MARVILVAFVLLGAFIGGSVAGKFGYLFVGLVGHLVGLLGIDTVLERRGTNGFLLRSR